MLRLTDTSQDPEVDDPKIHCLLLNSTKEDDEDGRAAGVGRREIAGWRRQDCVMYRERWKEREQEIGHVQSMDANKRGGEEETKRDRTCTSKIVVPGTSESEGGGGEVLKRV